MKKSILILFLIIFSKSLCIGFDCALNKALDCSGNLWARHGQKLWFTAAALMIAKGAYNILKEHDESDIRDNVKQLLQHNGGLTIAEALTLFKKRQARFFDTASNKISGAALVGGSLIPLAFGYMHKLAYK